MTIDTSDIANSLDALVNPFGKSFVGKELSNVS
jgi:hypothetical protein